MRAIRSMLVAFVAAVLMLGSAGSTTAQAAKPCNQYPTFIQPITCRVLEKLP